MNKYIPKQHGCPYRTSDGICVHKGMNMWKIKKKSFCAYNNPEKCGMYCEWVEARKEILVPINPPLHPSHKRGVNK